MLSSKVIKTYFWSKSKEHQMTRLLQLLCLILQILYWILRIFGWI